MTLEQARKILGLAEGEDPRPRLEELCRQEKGSPDVANQKHDPMHPTMGRKRAREWDQALALVKASVGGSEPFGKPVFRAENEVANKSMLPPLPKSRNGVIEDNPEPGVAQVFRIFLWSCAVVGLIGFGIWLHLSADAARRETQAQHLAFLQRKGEIFIENRRWQEAAKTLDEIARIDPNDSWIAAGRERIESGKSEELSQFIGYWSGEAIAALEAERWEDARRAVSKVLDRSPEHEEMRGLLGRISEAEKKQKQEALLAEIRAKLAERKYDEAIAQARRSSDEIPEAADLLVEALRAKDKAEADLKRARVLLEQAKAMDDGEFSEAALEMLREALSLAPDDREVAAAFEKMSAYARVIRVPGDFDAISEALDVAKDRDRILIGEGVWSGPLLANAAVQLEGLPGKTVIECEAGLGCVLAFTKGIKGARVSGVILRHRSFDAGEERFSLASVAGSSVDFFNCRFEQGSGHGLSVSEGAEVKVARCRFTENGWNGIAATGQGTVVAAESNQLEGNFQNGVEAWDGASLILSKNICAGNSRNGIHIDSDGASATIRENSLSANREFGIVITALGGGEFSQNLVSKNLLGGAVVHGAAGKVDFRKNTIASNQGPGLALGKGLRVEDFLQNHISGNGGEPVMADLDLTVED